MPPTRISQLASRIQHNTAIVESYLQARNLPTPSFDENGLSDFNFDTEEARNARDAVIEDTAELHDLLLGPRDYVTTLPRQFSGAALQAITLFSIPSKVPLNGEISFADLAKDCPINQQNLTRLLRFAMVRHRLFREPRRGYIAHTLASRSLVEDKFVGAVAWVTSNATWSAHAHLVDALEKWDNSDEHNETAFNIAFNTTESVYEFHKSHPEHGKNFATMIGNLEHEVSTKNAFGQGYPWDTIGDNIAGGTVVDIGGSIGTSSILLARRFPNLKFIVQDLPGPIASGKDAVPADVSERVEFVVHDFFTEQPVNADAYFFRYIFHNWGDRKVLEILRALVPALRPGAKVIINDYILPEPGSMDIAQERRARTMDITMLSWFNARERERAEWEDMLRMAEPRFTDIKSFVPKEAGMGFIEATWR